MVPVTEFLPALRFNPRSRGGSDDIGNAAAYFGSCFNPRSRGGSDAFLWNITHCANTFQSTLPWWERHQLQYLRR